MQKRGVCYLFRYLFRYLLSVSHGETKILYFLFGQKKVDGCMEAGLNMYDTDLQHSDDEKRTQLTHHTYILYFSLDY